MRLRAIHLASVLLLLTSMSGAETSGPRSRNYTIGGHYLSMILLAQEQAAIAADAPILATREPSTLAIPAASVAQHRLIWTMRPPAAHTLLTHAVTSFGV